MMMHVLVEGSFDEVLFRRLLDDLSGRSSFRIHVARGVNAARPAARKYLLVDREPVALIFDSDTREEQRFRQQRRDLEDYLAWGGHDVPYAVVQFVPEAEVIFFEQPGPLERILGHALDTQTRVAGRFAPRDILATLYRELSITDRRDLVPLLTESDLEQLRSHETVVELRKFVEEHG